MANQLNCLRCGTGMQFIRREKFQPGSDKFAGTADEAKTGSSYLPPDALGGLPRKKCPLCGAVLDFDYGRCPYCEHEF